MITIKTTGIEDYLDPEGGNAWVQALIIGDHGVGKTPFAGKWPKPIFAMCEHGTMSIAKDALPYAEIHTDADMDAFVQAVRLDSVRPIDKRQYLTVVVDTIDSYQGRLMDHRVAAQGLDRFTGWDNWDWLDAKLSKALRALSNLPIHLVVNMHYKKTFVGEGEDKAVDREARLKGDMKTKIYQEFDLIGFMETYYTTEGGARVRKHRIRWWPEPGYEMVRSRAVGPEGVLLPQFTPVNFDSGDFQIIFDSIVTGAEGLEDSKTLAEVQTADDIEAAALPTPDEGAGPVADPKLPPAQKEKLPTIKELLERVGGDPVKAQQMLDWENNREGDARPSFVRDLNKIIASAEPSAQDATPQAGIPSPDVEGASSAPAENAPEPESSPPADPPAPEPPAEPEPEPEVDEATAVANLQNAGVAEPVHEPVLNGKGTAEEPVIMDEERLNNLDGPKYAALVHVHSPEGKCLKGRDFHADADKPDELPMPDTASEAAQEPPVEPAAPPAAGPAQPTPAPAVDGQILCGAQPASMAERGFAAQPGCGKPITNENKAPLAVVKYKTHLCTDCFASAA